MFAFSPVRRFVFVFAVGTLPFPSEYCGFDCWKVVVFHCAGAVEGAKPA